MASGQVAVRVRVAVDLVADVAQAFAYAREVGLDPIVDLTRSDGSTVPTAANPIGLSATPASYRLAPPRLGEHSDQVRREVGG